MCAENADPPSSESAAGDGWPELLAEQDLSWPQDPELDRQLGAVFAASDYVARHCRQSPRLLLDLVESGALQVPGDPSSLAAGLAERLADVADEEGLEQALRHFRRREMVRIIWRDLAGLAELDETMADLSALADACIGQALDWLHRAAVADDGEPRDRDGRAQRLLVVGMGKLGACELNLSSDIDLIFLIPGPGETDGRRSLSSEQFFTRLGRRLIKALAQSTEDGFVFRVDMRLRPFGESGPLVVSLDAYEEYLLSHARGWERYAAIKARVICGADADRREFEDLLRPFVYRRYTDFGVIQSIREMKRSIETELERKGIADNIKLGPGGIREIEFIGQAFQLARGGREPELQIRPILEVLTRLEQARLIPDFVAAELQAAYVFLRRLENRLQAWRDEQTHDLPQREPDRGRVAVSMGFDDWAGFLAALDWHRTRVHAHFLQVFASPQTEDAPADAPMHLVWTLPDEDGAHAERLAQAGFRDAAGTWQALRDFRAGAAFRAISPRGAERLDQLMPMLLEAAAGSPEPDLVLARLLELLAAILRRTAYLDLLVENPLAVSQLVRLVGASSWILAQMTRQPLLLDELIDPRQLYSPLRRDALEAELDSLLDRIAQDDLEQQMEQLRQFALGNRLRVAAADVVGAIPLRVVSDYLTDIAEVVLSRATRLAWQQLRARHGSAGQVAGDSGFVVVAYGKLGGIELGYGSDLDLVFLHGSESVSAVTQAGAGQKSVANDVFYARVGQRLVHLLTTRTHAGVLFEVDTRLRPNGESGMLVSSLAAFERYQRENAWTWEHQALLRARAVAGDAELIARFDAVRRDVLVQQRDADVLRQDVLTMREKMRTALDRSDDRSFDPKQGAGGVADIEFMVQYAVLRWAHRCPDLVDWTDNLRLLEGLAEHGLLRDELARGLIDAYFAFRAVQHRSALQEAEALVPVADLDDERALVAGAWRELMES